MKKFISVLLLWLSYVTFCHGQLQPIVSNIQASQRAGTKLVDISYSVAYGGGTVTVWIEVSNDGGRSFIVPAKTFSGHIGQNVQPGTNRTVVWNAEADFDGMLAEQMRVRVNARGGVVPIPPPNMVYIPGGHFYMGNWEGGSSASARQVYISPMFMDRYEVWGALCQEVREWALLNNYTIDTGFAREGNHPSYSVQWYNALKWCNARSEKEGLTPVYYTNTELTSVYRNNIVYPTNSMVKWNANGYRLPTEAEWEKAARGGLSGKEYPWGDNINNQMANYLGSNHPWSGLSPRTTPVGYYNSFQQGGGNDMANGYGIYDMSGNLNELCWDRWSNLPQGELNPRGPATGTTVVFRGGAWDSNSSQLRCANRYSISVATSYTYVGFRCVRGL
jgi:formylglycine-generating enzyme